MDIIAELTFVDVLPRCDFKRELANWRELEHTNEGTYCDECLELIVWSNLK